MRRKRPVLICTTDDNVHFRSEVFARPELRLTDYVYLAGNIIEIIAKKFEVPVPHVANWVMAILELDEE
ncbi:MAG: hypothetical protein ACLQVJ_07990 [Syntrophobacteraceae bacterium]